MVCVSCGHCCKTMSPINYGYCPLLVETPSESGTIYHCSDYANRPKECKDHDYNAAVCPVGIATLNLITDQLIKDRMVEVRSVIKQTPF